MGIGPRLLEPHQPCDQPRGRRRQQNGVGGRHLLHAGREVRRLPHRGVIHMQAIVNGTHHHFPRLRPMQLCMATP